MGLANTNGGDLFFFDHLQNGFANVWYRHVDGFERDGHGHQPTTQTIGRLSLKHFCPKLNRQLEIVVVSNLPIPGLTDGSCQGSEDAEGFLQLVHHAAYPGRLIGAYCGIIN